jgi:uncharacterized protein (DUF305 family)
MTTLTRLSIAGVLVGCATAAMAQDPPIVLPGPPGQAPRIVTAAEATRLAKSSHSPADTAFMQHMIVHHQQAVDMAALVAERTNNPDIIAVAGRITAAQADEMTFMRQWLTAHGEPLAMPGGHSAHAGHAMKGMASVAQMAALAEARGTAFDRSFLQLMIPHHIGALQMVEDLLEQQGTAHDPVMFQFTSDVVSDQKAEIARMNLVLAGLSGDPRATLKPGITDAGEAISHLRRVATLPKPAGFYDPALPAQLQPRKARRRRRPARRRREQSLPRPSSPIAARCWTSPTPTWPLPAT